MGINNFIEAVQFSVERSLERLSPFTTDVLVLESNIESALFPTPLISLMRLFVAIPFANFLVDTKDDIFSIEKNIYAYTSTNMNANWDTSIFIAGTSELVISFGPLLGGLIIVFFWFSSRRISLAFCTHLWFLKLDKYNKPVYFICFIRYRC